MLSLSYGKRSANSNYNEMVWWILKKLNIELSFDSAIPLLGIYIYISPKELKAGIQTDTYTPMFTAALFTIAKR